MFRKLALRNFRTHRDSQIELGDVTLLIGGNNSGKTNFLEGLHFFSKLVSRANPKKEELPSLRLSDYYRHCHWLSQEAESPLEFQCSWENQGVCVDYSVCIFPSLGGAKQILCRERLVLQKAGEPLKTFESGYEKPTTQLLLRRKVEEYTFPHKEKVQEFFQHLSSFSFYHLQPGFLEKMDETDWIQQREQEGKRPFIPAALGHEGGGLQNLLRYVVEYEREQYARLSGFLRQFEKSFNAILVRNGKVFWQFLVKGKFFHIPPQQVSDGLLRVAAIALLCSLPKQPSLIMIDEMENGLNPRAIRDLVEWLRETAQNSQQNTQFLITSHSPLVLQQFHDRLHAVYNVYLRKKHHESLVTNLNDALLPLVNMGTLSEVEVRKEGDKELVKVSPGELIQLFSRGLLGAL